jgi:predicted NAD/FAD-binding protein
LLGFLLQVLAFPVQMLVRFWVNHHLLDLVQRPCWRVVKGRSKTYVDRVLSGAQRVASCAWQDSC